jgi:hypothetical protein
VQALRISIHALRQLSFPSLSTSYSDDRTLWVRLLKIGNSFVRAPLLPSLWFYRALAEMIYAVDKLTFLILTKPYRISNFFSSLLTSACIFLAAQQFLFPWTWTWASFSMMNLHLCSGGHTTDNLTFASLSYRPPCLRVGTCRIRHHMLLRPSLFTSLLSQSAKTPMPLPRLGAASRLPPTRLEFPSSTMAHLDPIQILDSTPQPFCFVG